MNGLYEEGADNKTVSILDMEIPVIEYKGERVITFKTMDRLHKRPEGTAGRNFRQNRSRFEEGKHYFEVNVNDFRRDLWEDFGFSKFASKVTLITRRGYTMLVKSFNDDLAWKVQEELTDYYFQDGIRSDSEHPLAPIDLIIRSALELKRIAQKQIECSLEVERIGQKQTECNLGIVRIEQKQKEHENRLSDLEAKIGGNSGNTNYWTIRAYCKMNGFRINQKEAAEKGRRASRLSKKLGIKVDKSADELFGNVNSYHEDVLKEVFKDLSAPEQSRLF